MPKGIGYGPKAAKQTGKSLAELAKMKQKKMSKGEMKHGKTC